MNTFPGGRLVLNQTHPLNRGRQLLLLTTPYTAGGSEWVDLTGRHNAVHSTMSTVAVGWKPTTRPGGFGHVAYDKTTGTKTSIPSHPIFDAPKATWGMWVRFADSSVYGQQFLSRQTGNIPGPVYRSNGFCFANRGTVASTELAVVFVNSPGQFVLYNTWAAGTASIASGNWAHLIITYGQTTNDTIGAMLNGVGIGSFSVAYNWVFDNQDVTIGWAQYYDDLPWKQFTGAIDGVTFWDRNLSLAEAQAEYHASQTGYQGVLRQKSPTTYSLAGIPVERPAKISRPATLVPNRSHPLNNGRQCLLLTTPYSSGGGKWIDVMGRHNAAHSGMTTSAVGMKPTSRPGGYGHISYNVAQTTKTSIPSHVVFDAAHGTWGMWIRYTDTTTVGQQFLTRCNANLRSGFDLYNQTSGDATTELTFLIEDSGGNVACQKLFAVGETSLQDGNWKHLLFVYSTVNGETNTVYINGVAVGGANNTRAWAFNNQDVMIGWSPYSDATANSFTGNIDAVTFWNRNLTATEAWEEYVSGKSGYQGVLVYQSPVFYPFGLYSALPPATTSVLTSAAQTHYGASGNQVGEFLGTFTYQVISATRGRIIIDIQNTTDPSLHGSIVAMAWCTPNDGGASFTSLGISYNNTGLDLIATTPGTFDCLNATTGFGNATMGLAIRSTEASSPTTTWNCVGVNPGGPESGIRPGQRGTIVIEVTGTNLSSLLGSSFASLTSSGVTGNWFPVHFRWLRNTSIHTSSLVGEDYVGSA